ncbi:hypothetical protein LCGC14_1200260 [marine sediment metagenome]|uniref:DNA (cytosine-5-)-methyltransferase n=1 Tax=marine sediment metagenome TaxID=412755 RepID=A0A0F9LH26_9ZZZZ|nr:hypothetical protein [Candidatus Aminicenantes bacterium]HEB34794.1 hypothetical protein [Candidatus Aminicenantes bacterium]
MNQLFTSDKIILDLCGGTGAWSKPYADAGYDVRIITLPEQDVTDYIPPADVYGILAAPPCTMFSIARQTAATPRDFIKGMIPINACIRIAATTRPAAFFALENPGTGKLIHWLGQPNYKFHPWHFGDARTKITALWGYFYHPVKLFADIKDVMTDEQIALAKQNNLPWPGDGPYKDRRAITPTGFAKAFFKANK